MVKLYGFCLSIAYIARRCPTYRVYRLSDKYPTQFSYSQSSLCMYVEKKIETMTSQLEVLHFTQHYIVTTVEPHLTDTPEKWTPMI